VLSGDAVHQRYSYCDC